MFSHLLFRLLLIFSCSALVLEHLAVPNEAANPRRVCYYTNWAQYRDAPMKFYPENIDTRYCDILIYAFAKLQGNKLAPYEWNDESTDWSTGMYERFNNLKQNDPNIKTLLAVGGWNMGTSAMTVMLSTTENRAEFVTTTITYLRTRNFDGIDLDFEYPGSRGSPPEDKERYTQLVQELRAAFKQEAEDSGKVALLLTAAVPPGRNFIDAGYEISKISVELDFIFLMAYDMRGGWNTETGHQAPLRKLPNETDLDATLNVEWAANRWLGAGCPKEKLVIGIPTYGRSYTLADPTSHDVKDPVSGSGSIGTYTKEAGMLSYYEVCEKIGTGGEVVWITDQSVPYYFQEDFWVGYDDVKSVEAKSKWVMTIGFGGAMIWSLDFDDFTNSCGGGAYPLLSKMSEVLTNGASSSANDFTSATTTQTTAVETTTTTTSSTTTTEPSGSLGSAGDFCVNRVNGHYAHPTDCEKYIQCHNRAGYIFTCVGNLELIWDPREKTCNFPNAVPDEVCDRSSGEGNGGTGGTGIKKGPTGASGTNSATYITSLICLLLIYLTP